MSPGQVLEGGDIDTLAGGGRGVYALVAGGGTGGHITPAIAVGRALVEAGHPVDSILFLGAARGMERRLVPDAGFDIVLLPGRGIARRLTLDNVEAITGLAQALRRAVRLVRRLRPKVVVSVGGYASFPCVAAAALCRVPVVIAESNAVPGLANRLAGRVAAASAVTFPGTPLPRAVVTGNPVRPEMAAVDRSGPARAAARAELGLPQDATVVAVAGGSLGSGRINTAVVGLARRWSDRSGWAIRHAVGERDAETLAVASPPPVAGGLVYQQVRFEDRMDLVYAAADLAVQRSGASTVAELAAAGMPAVLIPLPGAPGDHQTANAKTLEDAGAAVLIPDHSLDEDALAAVLDQLVADPTRLAAMGEAARALARPDAAARVAELAERCARD